MNQDITIQEMKQQVNEFIGDGETLNTLMTTTFNGLQPNVAKRAMLEALMLGFNFTDFLKKNLYAIPFKDGYSLVSSIDYARKVGMRSGVVGKSAPVFTYSGGDETTGKVESCTVTIKRKVGDYVGEYSATAFMREYSTGRNLWASKPMTMIAKVAEMSALRMACPEEMAKVYVEEEYQKEKVIVIDELEIQQKEKEEWTKKLYATKDLEELKNVWANIPGGYKNDLEITKNEIKQKYDENTNI